MSLRHLYDGHGNNPRTNHVIDPLLVAGNAVIYGENPSMNMNREQKRLYNRLSRRFKQLTTKE